MTTTYNVKYNAGFKFQIPFKQPFNNFQANPLLKGERFHFIIWDFILLLNNGME